MAEMELSDDSILSISEVLAKNSNLYRLYLQDNAIAMEGAMSLA
jgi:hypothetical protein